MELPKEVLEKLPLMLGWGPRFRDAATIILSGCSIPEALVALGKVYPIKIFYKSEVAHKYTKDGKDIREMGTSHVYHNGFFIHRCLHNPLCSLDKPNGRVGSEVPIEEALYFELVLN